MTTEIYYAWCDDCMKGFKTEETFREHLKRCKYRRYKEITDD